MDLLPTLAGYAEENISSDTSPVVISSEYINTIPGASIARQVNTDLLN